MIIIMPITTTAPILVTLEKKIKKGRKEDKEEEKKSINQSRTGNSVCICSQRINSFLNGYLQHQ